MTQENTIKIVRSQSFAHVDYLRDFINKSGFVKDDILFIEGANSYWIIVYMAKLDSGDNEQN